MKRALKVRLAALATALALVGAGFMLGMQKSGGPDLDFITIQGERIAMRDLRGFPVLVNFWASNCPSCLEEAGALSQLYQQYAPRGLKVVGIAMSYDMPSNVKAMAESMKIPYPVVLDHRGEYARTFSGVELVPYSVLLAPDGRIVLRRLGMLDMAELRERIEKLLTEG